MRATVSAARDRARRALAGSCSRDDAALLSARKRAPAHVRDAIARLFRGDTEQTVSERHLEVLRTALQLFAERGYAGASLRELARRLGVAQPSLYHYFETKEQLVEQIIVHLGAELLSSVPADVTPPTGELEDIPRLAIEITMGIWEGRMYAAFVQFLFVVAVEQPQLREAMRMLYERGAASASSALLQPFIERGEITEVEGRALIRTAVNSIGLQQIEERLLYGQSKPSADLIAHAAATEAWLRDAVRQRLKR